MPRTEQHTRVTHGSTEEHSIGPSVEELVYRQLSQDCPYRFYFKNITCEYVDGVLTLRGQLPTFYFKQVLQSWLRDVEGVEQIDNQVDVVSANAWTVDSNQGTAAIRVESRGGAVA